MKFTGNDINFMQKIQHMYTVNGLPNNLFTLKAQPKKTNLAVLDDVLNPDYRITIDFRRIKVNTLDSFEVHAANVLNQEAIDNAKEQYNESKKAGKPMNEMPEVPQPVYKWQLTMKLMEMIQMVETGDIMWEPLDPLKNPETMKNIMEAVFPGYDKDEFKIHYMNKVYKWYLILKEYKTQMPPLPVEEEKVQNKMVSYVPLDNAHTHVVCIGDYRIIAKNPQYATDVIEVNTDDGYRVQLCKRVTPPKFDRDNGEMTRAEITDYHVTNAMDGGGNNCFEQFKDMQVEFAYSYDKFPQILEFDEWLEKLRVLYNGWFDYTNFPLDETAARDQYDQGEKYEDVFDAWKDQAAESASDFEDVKEEDK